MHSAASRPSTRATSDPLIPAPSPTANTPGTLVSRSAERSGTSPPRRASQRCRQPSRRVSSTDGVSPNPTTMVSTASVRVRGRSMRPSRSMGATSASVTPSSSPCASTIVCPARIRTPARRSVARYRASIRARSPATARSSLATSARAPLPGMKCRASAARSVRTWPTSRCPCTGSASRATGRRWAFCSALC